MARQTINCGGVYGTHYFLDLDYVENATSSTNNSSNITITGRLRSDGYSFYGYILKGTMYVDGTQKSYNEFYPTSGQIGTGGVQVVTWTGDIPHNNDGTKTISVGFKFETSYPNLTATTNTKSGWALTSIPRGSKLTAVSGEIESGFTPSIDVALSGAYHKMRLYDSTGSTQYAEWSGVVSSTNCTLTAAQKNTIYNANKTNPTITFIMRLYTYASSSSTTQIGETSSLQITREVKNANPTISFTAAEGVSAVTTIAGSSGVIRNVSSLSLSVTGTGQKSATIVQNTLVDNQGTSIASGSANPLTNTFTPSNRTGSSLVITATTKDGRGNAATATKTYTYYDYIPVTINEFKVNRTSPTASSLTLYVKASVWNGAINSKTSAVAVKIKIGSAAERTLPASAYTWSNNTLTINNVALTETIAYTSSANCLLTIVNSFGGTTLSSVTNQKFVLTVGVADFEIGHNVAQVNGDLYVATSARANAKNVMTEINNTNSVVSGHTTTINNHTTSINNHTTAINTLNGYGHIQEMTTNSLGTYVKFTNGLMITFQTWTLTNIAINAAWGSLYGSGNQLSPNFPATFKSTPIYCNVNKNNANGTNSGNYWVMANGDLNTIQAGTYQLLRATSATLANIKLEIFAIGFWK